MKRVPIAEAKRIAKRLGMSQIVMIMAEEDGRQHVVTWGKRYFECVAAADGGNWIKKHLLQWPLHLCHAKPARQLKHEAGVI